jgi:hypothetical protein
MGLNRVSSLLHRLTRNEKVISSILIGGSRRKGPATSDNAGAGPSSSPPVVTPRGANRGANSSEPLVAGTRVRLANHAAYRDGRGSLGTVALVFGWRSRWAVVDVDHHGEVTCRVSELVRVERVPSWVSPVVDGPTGPGMG